MHKSKMSMLPNLLTIGNMFFGFWSIIMSLDGNFKMASYFIIIGGVCDALDGKVARLVKSCSNFGVEFDSLSDIITFGAAPSFMIYSIFERIYLVSKPELSDLKVLFFSFAFIPLLFTGIRLARFNAELTGYDKESFSGLPSPASALTIISFVLYDIELYEDIIHFKWISIIAMIVSYLMISRIQYSVFPVIFSKKDSNVVKYIKIAIISVLVVVVAKYLSYIMFPVMVIFVLFGFFANIISLLKKGEEE